VEKHRNHRAVRLTPVGATAEPAKLLSRNVNTVGLNAAVHPRLMAYTRPWPNI
jgi:hypothetical protein